MKRVVLFVGFVVAMLLATWAGGGRVRPMVPITPETPSTTVSATPDNAVPASRPSVNTSKTTPILRDTFFTDVYDPVDVLSGGGAPSLTRLFSFPVDPVSLWTLPAPVRLAGAAELLNKASTTQSAASRPGVDARGHGSTSGMAGSAKPASGMRASNGEASPVLPLRGGSVQFAQEVSAGSEPPLLGDGINQVEQRNESSALRYLSIDALSANSARVSALADDSLINSADVFGTPATARDNAISQGNFIADVHRESAVLADAGVPTGPRRVDVADPQVVGDLGNEQFAPVPLLTPLSSSTLSPDPFSFPTAPSSSETHQYRSLSDGAFPVFPGAFPLPVPETMDSLRVIPEIDIAPRRSAPEPSLLALLLVGGIAAMRARRR